MKRMGEIYNLAQQMLHNLSKVTVIIDNSDNNFQARYLPGTLTLLINEQQITIDSNSYPNISLMDYSTIILLHEIGHISDQNIDLPKINQELNKYEKLIESQGYNEKWGKQRKQLKLQAEINAWNYAEKFIDPELKDIYIQIRNDAIKRDSKDYELENERDSLKTEINNYH